MPNFLWFQPPGWNDLLFSFVLSFVVFTIPFSSESIVIQINQRQSV